MGGIITAIVLLAQELIPLLVSSKYRKLAVLAVQVVAKVATEYGDMSSTLKRGKAFSMLKNEAIANKLNVSDSKINMAIERAVQHRKK